MDWFWLGFQRWSDFRGRSRRKEYWYFTLINGLILLILVTAAVVVESLNEDLFDIFLGIGIVYYLFILVPSLSLTIRRFHDTGNTGWFFLFGLIPYVGSIIILVFMLLDGQPFENKWGPDPKQPVEDDISQHLIE